MSIYIPSSDAQSRGPSNTPKCRTKAEREARAAECERRRALNAERHEQARHEEALRDAKRPASAREAKRRTRERTPEEIRRQADARDKLHAALDDLANQEPTREKTRTLLAIASQAFGGYTAMGRLLAALVRFPSLGNVLATAKRPPDDGTEGPSATRRRTKRKDTP